MAFPCDPVQHLLGQKVKGPMVRKRSKWEEGGVGVKIRKCWYTSDEGMITSKVDNTRNSHPLYKHGHAPAVLAIPTP